jgi:hypothetical protein
MLSPEINYCIQAIRDMYRIERFVRVGSERLAQLTARVDDFGRPGTPPRPHAPTTPRAAAGS